MWSNLSTTSLYTNGFSPSINTVSSPLAECHILCLYLYKKLLYCLLPQHCYETTWQKQLQRFYFIHGFRGDSHFRGGENMVELMGNGSMWSRNGIKAGNMDYTRT